MGKYVYLIVIAAYALLLDVVVLNLVWRDRRHRNALRS